MQKAGLTPGDDDYVPCHAMHFENFLQNFSEKECEPFSSILHKKCPWEDIVILWQCLKYQYTFKLL
jgi:hypothetical protein